MLDGLFFGCWLGRFKRYKIHWGVSYPIMEAGKVVFPHPVMKFLNRGGEKQGGKNIIYRLKVSVHAGYLPFTTF